LCVFTDGLVERRPEPGDEDRDIISDNIDRVRDILRTTQEPERVCVEVLGDVVGDHVTEDDIAMLVVRRIGLEAPPSDPAERGNVLWTD